MIRVKENEIGTFVKERLNEFDICFVMTDNSDEAVYSSIKAVETAFGLEASVYVEDYQGVFWNGEELRDALTDWLNKHLRGYRDKERPKLFAATGCFYNLYDPECPPDYIDLSIESAGYYDLQRYYSKTKRSVEEIRGKITCPHCKSRFWAKEARATLECPECGADLSEGVIDHSAVKKYKSANEKAGKAALALLRKYKEEGRIPIRQLIAFGIKRDVDIEILAIEKEQ